MGQLVTPRARRQVRATLLALHVLAIVLLSFPGSEKLGDPRAWKERRTQAQLALWGERLRGWGVSLSNEALEAELWQLAQGYLRARAAATEPFTHYAHFAPQSWGMFKAPPLAPSAIAVDVRTGAGWRTVHESRSTEATYLASSLDNNRFRKQVGRAGRDPQLFGRLATWLARQALADFPDATAVRVRLLRLQSLPPARRRAGEVPPSRTERQRVFRRGELG